MELNVQLPLEIVTSNMRKQLSQYRRSITLVRGHHAILGIKARISTYSRRRYRTSRKAREIGVFSLRSNNGNNRSQAGYLDQAVTIPMKSWQLWQGLNHPSGQGQDSHLFLRRVGRSVLPNTIHLILIYMDVVLFEFRRRPPPN